MKKVVIVGGGLAGLTTAYYLSKQTGLEIELHEAQETLGGRVQTVEIDGFKFNYGAFMIFPWYTSFKKLLNELRYKNKEEHLDGQHEYVWDEDANTFREIHKHWAFDGVPLQTLTKALPNIVFQKPELYNPDPDRFSKMTVEEYFKNLGANDKKSLSAVNKIAVGYTYGAISQLPIAIYFGFAKEIMLNGGFKKVGSLPEGAYALIELLVKELKISGVSIRAASKISIDENKTVRQGNKKLDYDVLILASAAGDLLRPFLPKTATPITYNDHFAAYIKTENTTVVDGKTDWNILYTGSFNENEPQLTSIGNFEATFPEHPEKTLITYLRIPPKLSESYTDRMAKSKIVELTKQFLPDAGEISIPFLHRWASTMPIVSIEALASLQKAQGQNNIYFAGDYMGAPSMEVAIRSGEEVARLVIADSQ